MIISSNDKSFPAITNELLDRAEYDVLHTLNYGPENEMITRCLKEFPGNTNQSIVIMKVSLIDFTNSTHLSQHKGKCSVLQLSEIITGIDHIDERIAAGDPEVVNEIARCNNNGVNLFSFASKYCCYHNCNLYGRDDYSIIDTIVKEHLPDYCDIKKTQLKAWQKEFRYKDYNDFITKVLDDNGITTEFRRRKFDRFIWFYNRMSSKKDVITS